ncbi:hypothetical protein P308_01990 [Pseudomonas piscis]|nr:hypothetical protein P308_01990 [Pseudomonas piscis]
MQDLGIGHGQHHADGGLQPIHLEQLAPPQVRGWLADQPAEGLAKAAVGVEAGTDLGLDHRLARCQLLHAPAHAPQAGHLQEGHAEVALEGTPHGGRVQTQAHQVILVPAALGIRVQLLEQDLDPGLLDSRLGQWAATQAGAKTRFDTPLDRAEEHRVMALGLAGGTGQAAEHSGAFHPDIGKTFIGRIAIQQCLVQGVVVREAKQQGGVVHGASWFFEHRVRHSKPAPGWLPLKNGRRFAIQPKDHARTQIMHYIGAQPCTHGSSTTHFGSQTFARAGSPPGKRRSNACFRGSDASFRSLGLVFAFSP